MATRHKLNADKMFRRHLQHFTHVQFASYVQGLKVCFPNIEIQHAMSAMYNSLLANTYAKFLFEGKGIKYSIRTGCFKTSFQSAGSFLNSRLSLRMFGVFQTQSFLFKITTVLPLIKLLYCKLILKKAF